MFTMSKVRETLLSSLMFTKVGFNCHRLLFVFILISVFLSDWIIVTSNDGDASKILPYFRFTKSIYYDPSSLEPLDIVIDDSERIPGYPLRFISNFDGCSCQNFTCGCCAGMKIQFLNYDRKICTNVTFVPKDIAIEILTTADGEQVMKHRINGHNPPPFCVPLYFLPIVDFCVRLHSFSLNSGLNELKFCTDFETRIARWPIFILHFDCTKMGLGGINWIKPDNNQFFEPNAIFSAAANAFRPNVSSSPAPESKTTLRLI